MTIADRSARSLAAAGLAGWLDASSLTGMPVGEVRSAAVPWVTENPVMAPAVLRLTSAVACCHRVFLVDCTRTASFRRRS